MVGALLGGFIVYKWKVAVGRHQMLMVVGCMASCVLLLLILFAAECDTQRLGIDITIDTNMLV
jgi:uncharacterized membrane protein YeaQ/YmgE (transglycosylase-associated protein family)